MQKLIIQISKWTHIRLNAFGSKNIQPKDIWPTLCRSNVCRPNGRVLAVTTKHCVGQMSFGRVAFDPKARSPLQTPERLLKVQNTKKLHRITRPGAGNKTLLQP